MALASGHFYSLQFHLFSGQPLALLLKSNPLVSHLTLYDIVAVPGVAADLGHINSKAKVRIFNIIRFYSLLIVLLYIYNTIQ